MYCKNCKTKFPEGKELCPNCNEPLVTNLNYFAWRLKNGDEQAFNEIYNGTQGYTRKVVLYQLAVHLIDSSYVDDCMQEVYLRLHQKISLFDDEKASFSTWFETLRKNTILNFCEKMKKNQAEVIQEQSELLKCEDISRMPEHISDNDEISEIVNEMIDRLPVEQRVCIRKFYMEEMKQEQIAEELGIPLGTVKSRLSKGREKIGEMVLELQKKGKKIYSFSPILLFWWFFQDCSEPCLEAQIGMETRTASEVGNAVKTETVSEEVTVSKNQDMDMHEKMRETTKISKQAENMEKTAKVAKATGMSAKKIVSLVAVTCLAGAAAVGIGFGLHNKDNSKTATEEVVSEELETTAQKESAVEETLETAEVDVKNMFSPNIQISKYESCGWANGYTMPVMQNGLWGLIDYDGNVILEPSYAEYYYFPNEDGYAIFRDGESFYIVGRDGVIHTYQGNIDKIRIGEGNIVTYSTAYNADTLTLDIVYEKLDGTEVYRNVYNYTQDYWSEGFDEYAEIYGGVGEPFNNGKAYICKTHNKKPAIVELSMDGTQRILEPRYTLVPRSSYSEGYVACQVDLWSWNLVLNPETMEYSEYFDTVNTGLFPEFDWQSWHAKNTESNPFLANGVDLSDSLRESLQNPDFSNHYYDGFKSKVYYKNGNEVYNYGQFGCVRVTLPDETIKDVLFDYLEITEEHKISTAIAIYDEILFDDAKYLAVRNGEEWFYIDYQGNVVSESYKGATPFNDEGYALVLKEDGKAYVINQAFEVLECIGEASELSTCGELFKVDNEYVFYFGEQYK